MYPETHEVTLGKSPRFATLHFSFLAFEHLSMSQSFWNLQVVPWTLSKHKIHSSFYKNKKEIRHICGRAGWFFMLGNEICFFSLSKSTKFGCVALCHCQEALLTIARKMKAPISGTPTQKGHQRADYQPL